MPDGPRAGTGAYHGDRAGRQESAHAGDVRSALALIDSRDQPPCRIEAEDDLELSAFADTAGLEAKVIEHPDHRGVLGEHLGFEPMNAAMPGDRRQVLDQQGADALVLIAVFD